MYNALEESPVKTPINTSSHLVKNTGECVLQLKYLQVLDSLTYITNYTRSDIEFIVNKLSRFISNLSHDHLKTLTRIFRYLKYTLTYGLHFTKYPAVYEGYCNAHWIFNMKDYESTSGYVLTIDGTAVTWKSTKQMCIVRSTMESEFIALDKTVEEVELFRNFFEDIPC